MLLLAVGDDPAWTFGFDAPAGAPDSETPVATGWGPALPSVENVRGDLRLPVGALPRWFVAVLWVHAAVLCALMLTFLHQLRRIFQRVRGGAPFDAQNAVRLRWLGLLLLGVALFGGIARVTVSLAATRALAGSGTPRGHVWYRGGIRVPGARGDIPARRGARRRTVARRLTWPFRLRSIGCCRHAA